ncbi:MAG TPA: hypothetical protein VE076_12425, partial [Nitrososphaeraceae archaeon]|nr:hypothetical protein [Nitrososphaeraceae archaeon]
LYKLFDNDIAQLKKEKEEQQYSFLVFFFLPLNFYCITSFVQCQDVNRVSHVINKKSLMYLWHICKFQLVVTLV